MIAACVRGPATLWPQARAASRALAAIAVMIALAAAPLGVPAGAQSALAQTPAADPPPILEPTGEEGARGYGSGRLLVASLERIRSEAKAAVAMQRQAEAIRARIQQTLNARQEALSAEERALVALRRTLEPDAFEARAARFEQQVRALKKERRDQAEALRLALRDSTEKMEAALRQILTTLMTEQGGSVLIDTRNVILSATTLDITEEAIKRLDAAMPSLEVQWPPEAVE